MSIVAPAPRRQVKSAKAQLFFGFVEPCDLQTATKVVNPPRKIKRAAIQQPKNNDQIDFRDLCILLHGIAQKHVSRSDFEDFTALVRCTKLLSDFGLAIQPTASLAAPVASHDAALVTRDPKYRLLRNRAIACLATVADLSAKAPAKGSLEYQQGMRDAFQQASEIAVLFLEDIQNEV